MSAPAGRSERVYHQDYIARIRYENALPPPPGAPKLLDIPMEGLNYYTSAAFASRMARQQPLNIEADAELGMPIDLVGMPGIFDGDESCECICDLRRHGAAIEYKCEQQFKRLCLYHQYTQETNPFCGRSRRLAN